MNDVERISDLAITHGPHIAAGLLIIAISILAAIVVRLILKRLFRRHVWAARVGTLNSATAFHTILILGLLSGLNTLGVSIAPIIAGLGLGGIEGDTVSVMGSQGAVTEINPRYTVLSRETERVMIPNSLIFSNPLKIALPEEKGRAK